jgi:hypothetical protein
VASFASKIRRTWWVGACTLGIVMIVGYLLFVPGKPSGRFSEPHIACEGMAYYEFKDGKMLLIIPEDTKSPRFLGTVLKKDGRWELAQPDGGVLVLRCTFFSLKMANIDGTWPMTNSRYFWFSDYFDSLHDRLK